MPRSRPPPPETQEVFGRRAASSEPRPRHQRLQPREAFRQAAAAVASSSSAGTAASAAPNSKIRAVQAGAKSMLAVPPRALPCEFVEAGAQSKLAPPPRALPCEAVDVSTSSSVAAFWERSPQTPRREPAAPCDFTPDIDICRPIGGRWAGAVWGNTAEGCAKEDDAGRSPSSGSSEHRMGEGHMQNSQPLQALFRRGVQYETEHQRRVLDEQIQKFQRESDALRQLQELSELAEQELALEREQLLCESQAERQALWAEACAERQALQGSRKQLEAEIEHQRLAAASERLELRTQVDKLQEDLKSKQQQWHQSVDRLERQVQDLTRMNRMLTDELAEARQKQQPTASHTPPPRRRWRNTRVANVSAAIAPRPQASDQPSSSCGHQRDAAAQTGLPETSTRSPAQGGPAGSGPLPSALPLSLGALDDVAAKSNAKPASSPRAMQLAQYKQPPRSQTPWAERVWIETHGLEKPAEPMQALQLSANDMEDPSKLVPPIKLPRWQDVPGEMQPPMAEVPQPFATTVPHLPRSTRHDAPVVTAVASLHETSLTGGIGSFGGCYESDGTSEEIVLREMRNPEGRIERCFLDGRREIVFPNGLQKTVWADGRAAVHFQNGDVKESLRDGTVVYRYCATRTVQTTYTDGTNVYCFASGQEERHRPDGSKEVTFPDGTKRSVAADGSEIICFANGAVRRTPAAGNMNREDRDRI